MSHTLTKTQQHLTRRRAYFFAAIIVVILIIVYFLYQTFLHSKFLYLDQFSRVDYILANVREQTKIDSKGKKVTMWLISDRTKIADQKLQDAAQDSDLLITFTDPDTKLTQTFVYDPVASLVKASSAILGK